MHTLLRSPLLLSALLVPLFAGLTQEAAEPEAPAMQKLTPVLCCEAIEPCLEFWVGQLGFELTMSVPPGSDTRSFAMLNHGPVELMLQTYASLAGDLPEIAASAQDAPSFLFLEVADLDTVAARLGETEIIKARHETFYGSTEITVRSPGGHLVTLAQMSGE